jgi:hypothetical protein
MNAKFSFFKNPSILVIYPYLSIKDMGKTYFARAIQAARKKIRALFKSGQGSM